MKRLIVPAILGVALFSGCMEKPPLVSFAPYVKPVDTSYVLATVPAADPHNVLIEDFTGVRCPNCPNARDIVDGLEDDNPGRVNSIALYKKDNPYTDPLPESKYDFRTDEATTISNVVYGGIGSFPNGGVDRLPDGTTASTPLQLDYGTWRGTATKQLNVVDSMNLGITSQCDPNTRIATITVKATYLCSSVLGHNLSLLIVEDSFIDAQDVHNVTDTAYHFNSVLRGIVNIIQSGSGDRIAPLITEKPAGLVYERTYKYKIDAAWKTENCRIIGFITRDEAHGLSHVYQSVQTKVIR